MNKNPRSIGQKSSVIMFLFITLSHQACSKFSTGFSSKSNSPFSEPSTSSDSNQSTRVIAATCSLSSNITSVQLNDSVQIASRLTFSGDLRTITAVTEGTNKLVSDTVLHEVTPENTQSWSSWTMPYTDSALAGEYVRRIKFLNDQGKVICTTNILAITFITPAATPTPTPAPTSAYVPLVQNGTSDFKTKFAPGSPLLAENQGTRGDEVGINSQRIANFDLSYRVFVPPGSKRLGLTLGTYEGPSESKVAASFNRIPSQLGLQDITAATSQAVDSTIVLQTLYVEKKELPFWSPAMQTFVIMSQSLNDQSETAFKTSTGGWVYINALLTSGNRLAGNSAIVYADQRCYRSWYYKAVRENLFDTSGNPIETKNGVQYVHTVDAADVAYCSGTAK